MTVGDVVRMFKVLCGKFKVEPINQGKAASIGGLVSMDLRTVLR